MEMHYSVFHDGHTIICKMYCFIRHSVTSIFKCTPVAVKSDEPPRSSSVRPKALAEWSTDYCLLLLLYL